MFISKKKEGSEGKINYSVTCIIYGSVVTGKVA